MLVPFFLLPTWAWAWAWTWTWVLGLGFFFQARTASETLVRNRQVIGRSRCAHYITVQIGPVPGQFSGPSKGPGADLSSGHGSPC